MYSDVRGFVLYWNTLFPVDLWWRIKHKIPFNSLSHRQACAVDMLFEYHEYLLMKEDKNKNNQEELESPYVPGNGDWLKTHILTEEEATKEFDNFNLDSEDEQRNEN